MEVNPTLMGGQPIPTTWAQLRAVAQRLNVPGGKPICLSADWARLMPFVYQAGGTGQFKNATTAPFRVATNFYVNLIKDGLAATPDKLGSGWCGEAFGKEKVAIAFEGNWMLGYLKDTFPSLSYKLAPMPKGKTRGNLAFTVSVLDGEGLEEQGSGLDAAELADRPRRHEEVDVARIRAADA